jgi:hypothetical protein
MAAGAQGNQVQVVIRALPATQLLVVDLQVLSGTTDLALPAIAAQYLFSELFVELGIKQQAWALGSNSVHEAFSVNSCRNACF